MPNGFGGILTFSELKEQWLGRWECQFKHRPAVCGTVALAQENSCVPTT
jgi:hypothetical protein